MPKKSLCIQVPKTQGEKTLTIANKLAIRNEELEIQRNAVSIYVPLIRQPSEEELATFRNQVPKFQVKTRVFPERNRRQKTLTDVLEKLPPHLLKNLPRALDVVGDIAIVEIPVELKTRESLIGEAILKTHRNVRTVLAKAGAVSGTYRLRHFNVIAGEPKTSTVHKEFGCKYYVDVAKAYFSPRLSHEHERVAPLVQQDEIVV